MYENWAETRRQLDQELARERQQRGAQRGQRLSLWHSPWQALRQRWSAVLQLAQGRRWPPPTVRGLNANGGTYEPCKETEA